MEKLKKPFHEVVAEKLIEQLGQGTAPWQRPWTPGNHPSLPINPTSGKRYKGINTIQLMSQGHTDPRWMTYKQATEAGAQVRGGEKGTPIQYWKFTEEQNKTDEVGKPVLDKNDQPVKIQVKLERPKVFYACVFNAEQIDGLPPLPPMEEKVEVWNSIERAEQILISSGAKISHSEDNNAFYRLSTDSIHLPQKEQFSSANKYYATALHELGHWTGNPQRLDRELGHPFGSEMYAKEELRAEIASMILGDELGIGHDPEQHVSYVGSWIKVLQNDPLEIFRAAADAEKIQSYVLSLEQVKEQSHQTSQAQTEEHVLPITLENLEHSITKDKLNVTNGEIRLVNTFINVTYAEKDEAKALGAKWDRQEQLWFIPAGKDTQPFARWMNPPALSSELSQGEPEKKEIKAYLAIPFGEHKVAKSAGALWDKTAKSWYAGPKADMSKLERWKPEKVTNAQDPALTAKEEFASALTDMGCIVAGKHPMMDGEKHRIGVDGDKKGQESGFYIGYLDEHPAGYIKNNRTGIDIRWKSKGYTLNPEQKAAMQAEAAAKLEVRALERAESQEKTANRVVGQLKELMPLVTATPYLAKKGIQPEKGIFTDKDGQKTYIPVIDENGKQWSMQCILEDGTKRFAKEGKKAGCFHPIGGLDALSSAPVLVIGEGYATAKTLSEALNFGTVAAFDAGNLKSVALALHSKFPDKPIIIAGDDDQAEELAKGRNPGREFAKEAARAVGGKELFPIFSPGEQAVNPKGFSDFNDLAVNSVLGKAGVERQIKSIVENVVQQQKRQHQIKHSQKETHSLSR
ncbi:zincin-like metallopeptidase domain-containing protein [Xenorhabdus bovienii]|uniref:zincin-like metallopeptidase domain-containing protein n=1 Tax=Xenorhabdus bovienii TaxID=40576 RepID=UPI003DA2B34D